MAITRGYSFTSNELVDAAKLHRLVDQAAISDLSVPATAEDSLPISTFTAATNATYGWLTHRWSPDVNNSDAGLGFSHGSSYSGVATTSEWYMSAPHASPQHVICFGQYTCETFRFVGGALIGDGRTGRPLSPTSITDPPLVTAATAGQANNGNLGAVGFVMFDAKALGGRLTMVLRGLCRRTAVDGPIGVSVAGNGSPVLLWGGLAFATTGGLLSSSTHSSCQGILGQRADNLALANDTLIPTWLYGSFQLRGK